MLEDVSHKTHKAMDWKSKWVRIILMDIAPTFKTSRNDMFNLGYGSIITAITTIAFVVTFFYYANANSIHNKTAKFLVPANGGKEAGSMVCESVPLLLSNSYSMDSHGLWNSNTNFSMGSMLYDLELINAEYDSARAYRQEIETFAAQLKEKSAPAVHSDYAWNLVFGASFATVSARGEGKSTFFVNADSRIMYDVPIYVAGLSSQDGACIPADSTVSYDGTNFVFELKVAVGGSLCPQLSDSNGTLNLALGLQYDSDTGASIMASTIKIDAAAVTTAIAINYNIASLDSLSPVPSRNTGVLEAYIDTEYAPMQPVYCFNAALYNISGIDTMCFVKVGTVYAFPITAHYGQYVSSEFIPDACNCTSGQDECSEYDIEIGFLFTPVDSYYQDDDTGYGYYIDLIDAIATIQYYASEEGVNIQQYVRTALATSVRALYSTSPGSSLNDTYILDHLDSAFQTLCPYYDCFLLSLELYDYSTALTGPTINIGGRVIQNMACSNVFYDSAVLEAMKLSPPTDIAEAYLVCTDSLSTAISTGISNAYASAGLYSSVVLGILLFVVARYHKRCHPTVAMNSADKQEVVVRNAIAHILEVLLEKHHFMDREESLELQKKLDEIRLTDPFTHVEHRYHSQSRPTTLRVVPVTAAPAEEIEMIKSL